MNKEHTNKIQLPRLHFITQADGKLSHDRMAKEYCRGGGKLVQLRVKGLDDEVVKKIASEIADFCSLYNCLFIINDYVELAKEVGADGVHLGKNDMHPEEARRLLGKKFLIGGTADTFERIKTIHQYVDYIGLGPFRFTTTKEHISPLLGVKGYYEILSKCNNEGITTPVIAVGGITIEDVDQLMQTGIYGLAVSSDIAKADDIVETTEKWLEKASVVQEYAFY